MRTKIVKWLSIAALLLTAVFWDFVAKYQLGLNLLVSSAAIVVFGQAIQAKKYRWAASFVAIALLFNPAVAVFRLTGSVGLLLIVLSIAPFATSLAIPKSQLLLSIPSITDRNTGSQSF